MAFANAGYYVLGIDVDQGRTDAINRGESQIGDVSSEALTDLASIKTVIALNGGGDRDSENQRGAKGRNRFR